MFKCRVRLLQNLTFLLALALLAQSVAPAFAFGRLGRKLEQIDALGRITKFEYDIAGRMKKRTMPNGEFETMVYDNATGRLMSKTDFRGKVTTFVYETSILSPNYGKLLQKNPDPSLLMDILRC